MSAKSELPASPTAQQHLMTENTRSRSQQRPKRKWREWSHRTGSRKQRRRGKRARQESTRSETGGLWRRRRSRENGTAWRDFAGSETERTRGRGNVRGGSEPRWTERAQTPPDHLIARRKPGEVESRTAPAPTPGGWDRKQPLICHLCLQLMCRVRTALKSRLCPVLQ